VVFARDATSGALALVERQKDGEGGVTGLNGARAAVVSPDGKHVYVVALAGHAVASFARDAASGALTHLGTAVDEIGGVDGLRFPVAITTSPDGKHVYVAGNVDDEIAVFARDAESGALSFVEAEGASLDGPSGVVVSSDGRHAYVTNGIGSSLVRFDRDAATGALTFAEAISDGVGTPPASGLDGASEIAITPGGKLVYVTGVGETASTIAAFERDAATGELQFLQVERSGEGGFDGFAQPLGLALAARGRNLYVTGVDDDAVAVLAPEPLASAIAAVALASLCALAGARARG
jgi:6-phosphogluconolactonase (cycloisomerase 2 family)